MKIGLVLSGGGARGIAHLGVIQALEELGVRFSMLSGTSAVAVIGALYCYGYKPQEIFQKFQQLSLYKSVRFSWRMSGLFSLDGLKNILQEGIPENSFSALPKPLFIAATDLKAGVARYFSEGNLSDAVMASCCVPGIFSPVVIDGDKFVDGGIIDNLPVKPIRNFCDFVIASNCNPIGTDFNSGSFRTVI